MLMLTAIAAGIAFPLSRRAESARFQYPRPVMRSFSATEAGRPGVPVLSGDERTSLQFFRSAANARTLRFAFVYGPENERNRFANDFYGRPSEFIVFDTGGRDVCTIVAPGFPVKNFPRSTYSPGSTPYTRTISD